MLIEQINASWPDYQIGFCNGFGVLKTNSILYILKHLYQEILSMTHERFSKLGDWAGYYFRQ